MTIEAFKKRALYMAYNESISIAQIEFLMYRYFKQIKLPAFSCTYKALARCCEIKNNESYFTNVSRCSYNPFPDYIPLQRCNYPKQQVFYAAAPVITEYASMMSTSIMEVYLQSIENPNADNFKFTLSRWAIRRPLQLLVFPFSSNIETRNPYFYNFSKSLESKLFDEYGPENIREAEMCMYSYKFMSDMLSKLQDKEKIYRMTAAFYNAVIKLAEEKGYPLDGMLYPSANTEEAGFSVVLKKELIDNKIVVCDFAIVYGMSRDKNNEKTLHGGPLSNAAQIDSLGNLYW